MEAKYYYFSPLDFDTVFKTQVIGWVNIYREQGLDCTIVKLYPARRFSPRRIRSDRKGIRELYDGKLRFLFTLPDHYLITRLINAFFMLAVISPALLAGRKAVIQIRSSALHRSLKLLKRVGDRRIKIIYDSRAAAAEEYLYSHDQDDGKVQEVYERMKDKDRKMVALSDRIFCVSSVLVEYHRNLSRGSAPKHKFFLYPGNADERWFYFSEQLRQAVRHELGVSEKFVVAYSGGLEMPWHVPDLLFRFFAEISLLIEDAFLLILSGDSKIALDYAAKYGLDNDSVIILSADNRQVHRYLNASDIGTLFRTDDIMNRVASPTKFAEYIMCGLPVAISPSVGDLSRVIEETGWGIIYDGSGEFDGTLLTRKKAQWSAGREEIAAYGYRNFSKQAIVSNILSVYSDLQDQ